MAPTKAHLERQLKSAKSVLAVRAKKLADAGVDAETRSRDAKWRQLTAVCSQLESRLKANEGLATIARDLEQRKAEKAAAAAAPVEEKKEKKPKKEKAEKGEKKPAKEKKKKEEAPAE